MQRVTIVFDNVSKQFNHQVLFHDISMTFHQGTSYAIQGVSGTGKSTLLSLIGNLDTPTSGAIYYDGQDIHKQSSDFLAALRIQSIGYLFQHSALIKELSVIENIQLPGLLHGYTKKDCYERAFMLLQKIDLVHKKDVYPGSLSGGEAQRVALARALFNKPTFLIADEPTANLDYKMGQEIIKYLCGFQQEWNMSLIVATHDTAIAQLLDERYALCEKRLVKQQ